MKRDDRARVDAAAEERPERHVADEPQPDGLAQALPELVDELARPGGHRRRRSVRSQYRSTDVRPSSQTSRWPAGSLRTPAKIACGDGTYSKAR